ncbi:hypothetical protein ACFWD2_28540, partial [Streptomyces anthocyanicus]
MAAKDIGARGLGATVRVRAESDVDEGSLAHLRESLAHLREKVAAVLDRPGLPPASGEVRVVRAAAHHVELPWSAGAEIRLGNHLVIVHAREASARELADRLADRPRGNTDRVTHRGDATPKAAAPPPWRGGPGRLGVSFGSGRPRPTVPCGRPERGLVRAGTRRRRATGRS